MVGIYPASGFPSQARNPTHFTSHGHMKYKTEIMFCQEPPTRFELATSGLQNRCSTTELQGQAPQPGFEPGTSRLTVGGSTAELLWNSLEINSNRHGWTRTSNRQLRRLVHYPLCYAPLRTFLLYYSLGQSSTHTAQILISPPSSFCASLPSGAFSTYFGL